MKILIIEYLTSHGHPSPAVSPLMHKEGKGMVAALVNDLCDLEDHEIFYGWNREIPPLGQGDPIWIDQHQSPDSWEDWIETLQDIEAILPIAPESDGCLFSLVSKITDSQKLLLASVPQAVALASSKSATTTRLRRFGIPVVPTYHPDETWPESATGWIIKPDDGAGAETMTYAKSGENLRQILSCYRSRSMIIQPYFPGQVISLCALFEATNVTLFSVNLLHKGQHEKQDFSHETISVGAMNDKIEDFRPLVLAIAQAIDGLRGYIGIDMIETDGNWHVMDINPRITASYPGLRRAMGENPAPYLLRPFLSSASPGS